MILEWAWEKIVEGGPLMIPIGILSVVLWYRIIERALWFRREERLSCNIMEGVLQGMAFEDFSRNLPKGWSETCLGTLVREVLDLHQTAPLEFIHGRIREVLIASEGLRSKFLSSISALATAAPLLGLLGTVSGMISTFKVITHAGREDMTGMAGGISQALITTQAGLLVALPAVFLCGVLARKADVLGVHLEAAASELKRILGGREKSGMGGE